MKPLVIYHANCTDGFGAAFTAWLKLGDGAEYLPMGYGPVEWDWTKAVGRCVYILDFSFPSSIMKEIFERAEYVVWLDHHNTAFEMWLGGKFEGDEGRHEQRDQTRHIVLDFDKSGAMLAWEHFFPERNVPHLIQHIDDRDRWQFTLDGSKEIHAALASYQPWSFEQWQVLFHETHVPVGGSTSYLTDFKNQGHAILRAHNQNVQETVKKARTCAIRWDYKPVAGTVGYRESLGYMCNAPAFLASDLGHELANKSGTFGLVWSMAADGQIHCSLRSNGNYDVSMIAKSFGGGGHRNAAGFATDIETLLQWFK